MLQHTLMFAQCGQGDAEGPGDGVLRRKEAQDHIALAEQAGLQDAQGVHMGHPRLVILEDASIRGW